MNSLKMTIVFAPLLLAATGAGADDGRGAITIVTLGDSITRGVRSGVETDQTFAAVLDAELAAIGIEADVINVGIG
jgi:hypothetical protein